MNGFSEFPSSLIPEWADVKELKDKLERLDWENGERYELTENLILESFIHFKVFERKFNELNESLLKDLTDAEKREVLDHIKNILRNAPEDSLLDYLKYGVEYTVKRSEKRTYRLIDYENIENNSFIYGWEIKYPGSPYNIRPDFTLFINGIPIAIIEVKPSTREGSEEEAIRQIRRYEEESPELFRLVQLGIAYGHKKLFLPTSPNWSREKRLMPGQTWKIEKHEKGLIKRESIDELIKPKTLLNLIRWYTFFRGKDGSIEKIIGRYNQYSAAEKALKRIEGYLNGEEENRGLIWHWQGSGKTYTMFFIANKYFEEYFDRNPLIFFVVDRRDLQRQLRDFIDGLKASRFKNYLKIIESIEDLKKEITIVKKSEYMRNIVTRQIYIVLIQKFQIQEFETLLKDLAREQLEYLKEANPEEYRKIWNILSNLPEDEREMKLMELGGIQKREILLLIDEAHRSQYGLLASMMKNVFPNAMRFAFTGTPVFRFEERNTFKEFAYPYKDEYYLDVYFIKDSIEDGFTLPIIYDVIQEGKPAVDGIKILLQDEDIKRYIDEWVEASQDGSVADDIEAFLEEGVESTRLQPRSLVITRREIRQHLNKIRVFLTNEKRLEKLARFIAERIEEDTENFRFKAMIVTANREACVHMKRFLDRELEKLYSSKYGEGVKKWTEIVMTYNYNDRGILLDYREELIRRRGKTDTSEINLDIQREFKEEENPKILIVTDMLITGFDAPRLKVMYLDKPLYEHRLLQAIARVNRPYKNEVVDKKYGLIVDSVGLLKHVRRSIKKYELIADNRIAKDIEENILGRIERKVEEFKQNLKDLKNFMKTLTIEGRGLNIDVDEIKMVMKKDKVKALEMLKEDVEPKTMIIAAFHDTAETQILLGRMRETIDQYRALGSHPEKIHYISDIEILSYIYGRILYYIRGGKVPREFWDGLIEFIHEKTLVEDFRRIIRTKITGDMLKKSLQELREQISASKIISEKTVADAYRVLRSLLEIDLANPVYKAIYERIERAREEWTNRNIDNRIFAQILESSMREKREYDEKVSVKPLADRICDTISMLVNQQFGEEKPMTLDLKELRHAIQEVMNATKIVSNHETVLRTALLKDLFRELRRVKGNITPILTKLKNFADYITKEYVIREIKKARTSEGVAA